MFQKIVFNSSSSRLFSRYLTAGHFQTITCDKMCSNFKVVQYHKVEKKSNDVRGEIFEIGNKEHVRISFK